MLAEQRGRSCKSLVERKEKKRRNRAQQNGKKATANRKDCSEDTVEIKRSSRKLMSRRLSQHRERVRAEKRDRLNAVSVQVRSVEASEFY